MSASPAPPGRGRTRALLLRAARVAAAAALAGGCAYLAFTHRPRPEATRRALFQGVAYAREVEGAPRPIIAHVVTVEPGPRGCASLVTPGDPALPRPLTGRTTSAFLSEFHAQVAINGDFFEPWYSRAPWDYYPRPGDPVSVDGHAASDGVIYSREARKPTGRTLYIALDNRASFDAPPGEPYNAISGMTLLERGRPAPGDGAPAREPEPRTAVALDREGRRLILVAVDGRQPGYSEGVTLAELSEIIVRHGGYDAANLDGGGSTALVIEGASGAPEVLSTPVHTRIPGRERPVANHLGVFARPASEPR